MSVFRLLAFVSIAAISLAASELSVMGVEEVVDRHHVLDGKRIRVSGWLRYCQRLSCGISSRSDRDTTYLSIGYSRSFDKQIRQLVGRKITIEAILDAKCIHGRADSASDKRDSFFCTDRAEELVTPIFLSVN